jgi:hypothetical protein
MPVQKGDENIANTSSNASCNGIPCGKRKVSKEKKKKKALKSANIADSRAIAFGIMVEKRF